MAKKRLKSDYRPPPGQVLPRFPIAPLNCVSRGGLGLPASGPRTSPLGNGADDLYAAVGCELGTAGVIIVGAGLIALGVWYRYWRVGKYRQYLRKKKVTKMDTLGQAFWGTGIR